MNKKRITKDTSWQLLFTIWVELRVGGVGSVWQDTERGGGGGCGRTKGSKREGNNRNSEQRVSGWKDEKKTRGRRNCRDRSELVSFCRAFAVNLTLEPSKTRNAFLSSLVEFFFNRCFCPVNTSAGVSIRRWWWWTLHGSTTNRSWSPTGSRGYFSTVRWCTKRRTARGAALWHGQNLLD